MAWVMPSVEKPPDSPFEHEVLAQDLKRFLEQYDQRRKKSYQSVFPEEFSQWLGGL